MRLRRSISIVPVAGLCALLAGGCSAARVGDTPKPERRPRELLYPGRVDDVPAPIRPYVAKLLAADQSPVDAVDAKPAGVFARVVSRKHVLDGGLKTDGTLGGRPFVFVTVPEALYGRTLLQVFSAIGYSADAVLTGQLGEEKVVVVFRWEGAITAHPGRDGCLPAAWDTAVYPATWGNLLALVDRMAGDERWHQVEQKGEPADPARLRLRSVKERHFLLGFPDAGKERVRSVTYHALQEAGGADWEYRRFLERAMSAAEHFTGDGMSKPTIVGDAKPPAGFPEFLGPNRALAALPEVAVVGLGTLVVGER